MTENQPKYTSETNPGYSPVQDVEDVTGHLADGDTAPGARSRSDTAPGIGRTYPKATDDDSDDVTGHVFIESKDDSGTRRDA
jgi:hypothetical protein